MSEDDPVKHEGKWTRDDFPSSLPDAEEVYGPSVLVPSVRRDLAAWLNAHRPKCECDAVVDRAEVAERERDRWKAATKRALEHRDEWKTRAKRAEQGAWRIRFQHAVADLLDAKRERDEWKASAEKAEQLIPAYAMLDIWTALGRDSIHFDDWYDEHGYAEAWAELTAAVREARTAPAVTKADIEKVVIEWDTTPTPHDIDTDLRLLVDQLAALLSGDDPAVHVVRESDVAAVGVEQDSHGEWFADGEHVYTNGAEDARNLATGHLCMAVRRLAVARAIEAGQAVDPVEDKAIELRRVAYGGRIGFGHATLNAQEMFRSLARHVLGQEAGQ